MLYTYYFFNFQNFFFKIQLTTKFIYRLVITFMLSLNGLAMVEPYLKHLDNDIWELRPLRDRILFAYWDNNKFILLSLFMKQTQKTPQKEITKAKRNLEDFIKRSGSNEK